MHKIFAKPLFLGKKVIFLTECHSTNDELMTMIKTDETEEGLVILTDHQKKGKGQRGNVWLDEPGKNILMSVLVKPRFLLPSEQYLLNLVICLGVLDAISDHLNNSNVMAKWPNDIMVDDKKICGILIENVLQGNKLANSVIGIGLNLNQKGFSIPTATSLFLESDHEVNRDDFIETLLLYIERYLLKLKNGQKDQIIHLYHEKLYAKGETRRFRDQSGEFEGVILGIDSFGKLIINADGQLKYYAVKEIEFIY